MLIWTLIACSAATLCLLHGLKSRNKHTERTAGTQKEATTDLTANAPDGAPDTGGKSDEEQEEEEEEDGGDCEDEVEDCEGEEKDPVGDDKEEEDGMETEEILEKRKF